MTTVVDNNVLQNLGVSKPTAKPSDKLGQEAFLKLMTTQLQNQDPFKPMENGDFLGQIAQFSTVSGIEDLQSSFKDFASALTPNQGLQAAGLINRNVLIASDSLGLNGQGMKGAFDLPSTATQVSVSVFDAGGALLHSANLGPQAAGVNRYQWDGVLSDGTTLPAGNYKVTVDAIINNENIALKNYADAPVESITFGSGGNNINVNVQGLGSRAFSEILQIS